MTIMPCNPVNSKKARWPEKVLGILGLLNMLMASNGLAAETFITEPVKTGQLKSTAVISRLMPESQRGRGFKLAYSVNASLTVFWRYKTDFDNQRLLKNVFISSHRLVSRDGDVVITETEYSKKPGVLFKWKTTIFPDEHLLKYELVNPEESGHEYHYGYIQLEEEGPKTRITHVAYFDFFGASFWVNYPFKGGMNRFLKYTARWEQEFISEYAYQYMN